MEKWIKPQHQIVWTIYEVRLMSYVDVGFPNSNQVAYPDSWHLLLIIECHSER